MPELALRQPECQRVTPEERCRTAVDLELLAAPAYPRWGERPGRRGRAWPAAIRWPRPRPCGPAASPPALAAAALTQVELRRRAAAKFGPAAGRMFFTRAGLEQATRRGRRRPAGGAARGRRRARPWPTWAAGWASDALAAARAGHPVYAVDADPLTAALAAANADGGGAGRPGHRRVRGRHDRRRWSGFDAVFADPARRRAGRRPGVRPAVLLAAVGLRRRPGRAGAAHGAEAGARASTTRCCRRAPRGSGSASDGDLVEAAFWCGPLAAVPRRATLLPRRPAELTGAGARPAPVGAGRRVTCTTRIRRWSGRTWSPSSRRRSAAGWPTRTSRTSTPTSRVDTPFARRLEITDVLPFSLKRLRALLRERGRRAGWRSASGARRWSRSSSAGTCGWPARTRRRSC